MCNDPMNDNSRICYRFNTRGLTKTWSRIMVRAQYIAVTSCASKEQKKWLHTIGETPLQEKLNSSKSYAAEILLFVLFFEKVLVGLLITALPR